MRSEVLEAFDASGVGLRVEFAWRGDRFGHMIWLVEPNLQPIALLESTEGSSAETWPPSPPLQSVSVQDLPEGRRAALLVGMAGRSHWSASVEAAQNSATIDFDIACRTSDRTGELRSTYRVAFDNLVEMSAADAAGCRWAIGDRGVELVVSLATQLEASSERGELKISPDAVEGPRWPTARWRYRFSLEPGCTECLVPST